MSAWLRLQRIVRSVIPFLSSALTRPLLITGCFDEPTRSRPATLARQWAPRNLVRFTTGL